MSRNPKIQINYLQWVNPPRFNLGQKLEVKHGGDITDVFIIGLSFHLDHNEWGYEINSSNGAFFLSNDELQDMIEGAE